MRLYLTQAGRWVGTQADARKDGSFDQVEVPTDKPGLLAWLNDQFPQRKVEAEQARIEDKYGSGPDLADIDQDERKGMARLGKDYRSPDQCERCCHLPDTERKAMDDAARAAAAERGWADAVREMDHPTLGRLAKLVADQFYVLANGETAE